MLTTLLLGAKVEKQTSQTVKCYAKLITEQKEINKANTMFKHIAILVPAVAKSFHANAECQTECRKPAENNVYK